MPHCGTAAKPFDRRRPVGSTGSVSERLHHDEVPIDVPLVRSLVDRLGAPYAGLPLRRLDASGSTNAMFRLGDDLLVRIPRQPGGTATIEKERRWLPYVAQSLPVPVPEIVAVGGPGPGYAERWSVVRWLDGDVPVVPAPREKPRHDLAHDLAAVVAALRALDVPPDALRDPALRWYRGEPLAALDDDLRRLLGECRQIDGLDLDLDACAAVWDEAVDLPRATEAAEPRWYHGDLVAENLLVRDGRLAAVLDFGGLSVGDPTVDLAVAWELLDAEARETFRRATDADDAAWLRARGWALAMAVMTFPYYWATMPGRCAQRLAMARSILAEAS
jgi:aminoglycoside phosphotransferase (APT) family kinase protein